MALYKNCVKLEFQSRIAEMRLPAEEHAFEEEVLSIPEAIGLPSDCLYQVVDTFDPAARDRVSHMAEYAAYMAPYCADKALELSDP